MPGLRNGYFRLKKLLQCFIMALDEDDFQWCINGVGY